MSRARHHEKKMKKADGGKVDYYSGGSSNVAKEAEEKKHGGAVEMKAKGKKSKARLDKRPRRASGGRVGSDKSPFSSAASPSPKSES